MEKNDNSWGLGSRSFMIEGLFICQTVGKAVQNLQAIMLNLSALTIVLEIIFRDLVVQSGSLYGY